MKWAGMNVKAILNGFHYRINRISVRTQAQAQNVTDSEGIPGNQGIGGKLKIAVLTVTNANPTVVTFSAAPTFPLKVGQYVSFSGFVTATNLNGIAFTITAVNSPTVITVTTPTLTLADAGGGFCQPGGIPIVGSSAAVAAPYKSVVQATKPTWEDDQDPFDVPFAISPQTFDQLLIFPNTTTAAPPQTAAAVFAFPSLLCTEASFENDVNALEPISVSWESDGAIFQPTAAGGQMLPYSTAVTLAV